MRKVFGFLFLTLFLLLTLPHKNAHAAIYTYKIRDFESTIEINKDTSLTVTEEIEVFFNQPRHGIFRIIPVTYSARGKTIKAKFDLLSVTDESGTDYIYSLSRLGQSTKIKIGDPEKTLKGPTTYVIRYKMGKVIQRYDEHDELYWNVTGSEWDTDIQDASAKVSSPHAAITKVECFSGLSGLIERNCQSNLSPAEAEFTSTTTLGTGKDFSIVVGLDKNNQLIFPKIIQKTAETIFDNWGYPVAFLPLTIIAFIWYKKGRDKRFLKETTYYEPDDVSTKTVSLFERKLLPLVYHPINGLSPSEVGTIIDERVHINDVVAEIVELARLGYIKIRKIEKKKLLGTVNEYAFIKVNKTDKSDELANLKDYQKYLLKELFRSTVIHKSVKEAEKLFKGDDTKLNEARRYLSKKEYVLLSGLTNHFYEGLPVFKDKLYKRMKDERIFAGNPEKVRKSWLGIFILLEFLTSFVVILFLITTQNFGPVILLAILAIPGILLALSMPRRTATGYSLFRQIEGLKQYLKVGKWRHEVYEKHLFLEEILPLAISLGVVDQLANDLKALEVPPPSYFVGSSWSAFASDIGMFTAGTSNAFVSAPGGKWSGASSWSGGSGFSGGGFSGGGFGGGGGGSW